jgi:hypothetical protein
MRAGDATAATASGKLAPQSSVGGRMAQRQRTRSNWKMCHGLTVSSGLMGQRRGGGDHPRGPRDPQGQQNLAPAQGQAGPHGPHHIGTDCTADSEADQKHGQNDGEDIDRQAEHHPHQAGPHHFRAQCRGAG